MLQHRPNTFAQTNLSSSFFACDKAADHTFRLAHDPGSIRRIAADRLRRILPLQNSRSAMPRTKVQYRVQILGSVAVLLILAKRGSNRRDGTERQVAGI
jgi:hypothetical protein